MEQGLAGEGRDEGTHTRSRAWLLWSLLSLRLPMRDVYVAGFLLVEVLQYPLKVIYFAFWPFTTPPLYMAWPPTCGHLRPCAAGGPRQALWSGCLNIFRKRTYIGGSCSFGKLYDIYWLCLLPMFISNSKISENNSCFLLCRKSLLKIPESTEMCSVRSHASDCGLLGWLGAGIGLVEGRQGEQFQHCSLSLDSTLVICSLQ